MAIGIITAAQPIPYGSTVGLYARILGLAGTPITQATVSTAVYLLWNVTDDVRVMPASSTRSLTVASVVFDSLQNNDPGWTIDKPAQIIGPDGRTGYNFRYLVPATDTAAAQANKILRATVQFTFSDASVLAQAWQWTVLDVNL